MTTMMLMISLIFAPPASPTMTMISIVVASPASPNVTFEMKEEKDADDRHADCKDADNEG